MHRVRELLGNEYTLDTVSRTLRDAARSQHASAVGALHVTCSDECERECSESFQQWFAQDLLPELKFSSKSPFRSANLGARYEWGSIGIAEHHFATPPTHDGLELLVVKINAHVCVHNVAGEVRYGSMPRYGVESTYCGAVHAMLDGQSLPALDGLREAFLSEGKDRIAMLNDPDVADPRLRSLLSAVTSARLQARRAILDIQHFTPASPTRYFVVPCVTLNRAQRDTELVVGFYSADHRGGDLETAYVGLGDDPSRYVVHQHHSMLRIEDDHLHQQREARDHRDLVRQRWRQFQQPPLRDPAHREEVARLTERVRREGASVSAEALVAMLAMLAVASPLPLAVDLFICGACGIHHVYGAHRLAHGAGSEHDAKAILDDALGRIVRLPPEEAKQLVELLAAKYGVNGE